MIHEIQEISTLEDTPGLSYILVFWWQDQASKDAGDEPYLTEEFRSQIRATDTRIVQNAEGHYKLKAGGFYDPEGKEPQPPIAEIEYETVSHDPLPDIERIIADFEAKAIANKWSGDWTGESSKPRFIDGKAQAQGHERFKRTVADPFGVLSHPSIDAKRKEIGDRKREQAKARRGET